MLVGATAEAAAAGSPAITIMLMPAIDVGAFFIGREEREGDDGSGVATEDDDDADAKAGEYARDFLEVALSRLWEGILGRRMTTEKMMETSRDNEHKEDVVPLSMFETFCEGVRREMLRGRRRRRPPPEVEACPTWSSSSSSSNGASSARRQRNWGYICDNNNNDYTRQREVHNCMTI